MNPEMKKLKQCRRLAVMGGTFDPIHYGHLAAAEAVRCAYTPDLVLFIPSARPPHKEGARVTPGEQRYNITLLATADHPCFEVSRMELDRPGLSYTVDTIRALKALCAAQTEILFIIGADSIEQIPTWKDADKLLTLCRFVAVARPGWDDISVTQHMDLLRQQYGAHIDLLETCGVAASSTDIRERILSGKPVRYLLPPAVEQYIREHGLYAESPAVPDFHHRFQHIERLLSERLSEERFLHTQGVVQEAEKLAACYGLDPAQAKLAALLHDCAKEYTPEKKRALCRVYGIVPDEVMDAQIDLTHSLLSAEAARDEYGINDPHILQAIRYHTTGCGGMTLLDKIIMLADYIEPNREDYPGLRKMRELAYRDVNKALRVGIRHVIEYNKKRGRLIHPNSRKALKELKH